MALAPRIDTAARAEGLKANPPMQVGGAGSVSNLSSVTRPALGNNSLQVGNFSSDISMAGSFGSQAPSAAQVPQPMRQLHIARPPGSTPGVGGLAGSSLQNLGKMTSKWSTGTNQDMFAGLGILFTGLERASSGTSSASPLYRSSAPQDFMPGAQPSSPSALSEFAVKTGAGAQPPGTEDLMGGLRGMGAQPPSPSKSALALRLSSLPQTSAAGTYSMIPGLSSDTPVSPPPGIPIAGGSASSGSSLGMGSSLQNQRLLFKEPRAKQSLDALQAVQGVPRDSQEQVSALPTVQEAVDPSQLDPEALAQLRRDHRAMRMAKRQGNRAASTFLSSPGAFSSDTRDALLHQGKFDMSTVLQMHLWGKEPPSLVCDIAAEFQVLHANEECEKLFESPAGDLAQADMTTLISLQDQDRFSQLLAYLVVSERNRMEPQELTIVTLQGNMRLVRMEGVQLIGMWWQLDFFVPASSE